MVSRFKAATPDIEVRRRALDLLARREHSAQELQQKLRARGFDHQTITDVVRGLTAEGLLSDERFVEAFIDSRVNKGYGPLRIRSELQERGIGEALIARHLDEAERDWPARIEAVRRKRFGAGLPEEYKAQAQQMRFLQYRGFGSEQIRAPFRQKDRD